MILFNLKKQKWYLFFFYKTFYEFLLFFSFLIRWRWDYCWELIEEDEEIEDSPRSQLLFKAGAALQISLLKVGVCALICFDKVGIFVDSDSDRNVLWI